MSTEQINNNTEGRVGPENVYTREAAADRLKKLTPELKEKLEQALNNAGTPLSKEEGATFLGTAYQWLNSRTLLPDEGVEEYVRGMAIRCSELKMSQEIADAEKRKIAVKTAAKDLAEYLNQL